MILNYDSVSLELPSEYRLQLPRMVDFMIAHLVETGLGRIIIVQEKTEGKKRGENYSRPAGKAWMATSHLLACNPKF